MNLLTGEVLSASGLVVKFNVAIVEPPVRFRACAIDPLFLDSLLFETFSHLVLPQSHHDKSWMEGDGAEVRICYTKSVLD